MSNDAIILTADEIRFNWPSARSLRAYVMGVAADDRGKVYITESLSSYPIRHRPGRGRPGTIDFGFEGLSLYQRTGGLPTFVVFSLMVVKDRRAVRRAGEIMRQLATDSGPRTALGAAAKALGTSAAGASTVATVVGQISDIVGQTLENAKDKPLGEASGTIVLPRGHGSGAQPDTIQGSLFDVDLDYLVFDSARDRDSEANLGVHIQVDGAGRLSLAPT